MACGDCLALLKKCILVLKTWKLLLWGWIQWTTPLYKSLIFPPSQGRLLLRVLLSPHSCGAFQNPRQWSSFPSCSPPSNSEGLQKAWVYGLGVKIWQQHPVNHGNLPALTTLQGVSRLHRPYPFQATCDPQRCQPTGAWWQAYRSHLWVSDTFMLVHVFKGCLSLYALFRISKQRKAAFILGCSSVKHHSDEENEWQPLGSGQKQQHHTTARDYT